MPKSLRFVSAVSLAAVASALAGCATTKGDRITSSGFGGKANGEVGLATRALAALDANKPAAAVGFAERAVARTPDDAGFRSILGNAYFAAGRFASAEAAYKDALAIYPNQPQTLLKLGLALIAQGKHSEALNILAAGRTILDPANYGLAVALAGRPGDAVAVLETAARVPGADARIRQNLALAHALAGDWAQARIVAAQDVPANQLDARVQQWMQLAKPARTFDQVASLTGVTPNPSDPGQPVRLALVKQGTRTAAAAAPAPQPQAAFTPPPAPEPQVALAPPPPPPAPEPQGAFAPPPPPQPEAEVAALPPPPPLPPENPYRVAASSSITVKLPPARPAGEAAAPAFDKEPPVAKPAKLRRAAAAAQRVAVRPAALRRGNAPVVVQLGAYGSPQRVLAAWNAAARRYGGLRGYTPMSARFVSARGPVYRLAVKGFASNGEANALCASLRRSGGSCFVRNLSGDAPVQFASR